jgi:hypothetical protein
MECEISDRLYLAAMPPRVLHEGDKGFQQVPPNEYASGRPDRNTEEAAQQAATRVGAETSA